MSQYFCLWVLRAQLDQLRVECVPLLLSEVIFHDEFGLLDLSVMVLVNSFDAANHADADALVVVSSYVGSGRVFVPAFLNDAIAADHVVISDGEESPLAVPAVDLLCANVHVRRSGATVNYNVFHRGQWFVVHFLFWLCGECS